MPQYRALKDFQLRGRGRVKAGETVELSERRAKYFRGSHLEPVQSKGGGSKKQQSQQSTQQSQQSTTAEEGS